MPVRRGPRGVCGSARRPPRGLGGAASRPGPDSAARPASFAARRVLRSASWRATRSRARASSSCSRAIVEGGRALVQVAVHGQDRAEQTDRLVRGLGDPVTGADPVGDQLVEVPRRPAVAGGAGQDANPRCSGAVAPGPGWALLVGDPLVRQGKCFVVLGCAARSDAATGGCRRLG